MHLLWGFQCDVVCKGISVRYLAPSCPLQQKKAEADRERQLRIAEGEKDAAHSERTREREALRDRLKELNLRIEEVCIHVCVCRWAQNKQMLLPLGYLVIKRFAGHSGQGP